MAKQKIKVLYFLNGPVASSEDENYVEKHFTPKHQLCYRNALMIGDNEPVEAFDIVAGAVPAQYRAEADAKGPPVEHKRPKTPAASAAPKSPVAPPAPEPAKVHETPQEAATG